MQLINRQSWIYYALFTLWRTTRVHGQSCKATCTAGVEVAPVLQWSAKTFSTTIVAATVVQIVNTDLDTTKYSTIYNQIPVGYTVPTNTNAQGTQTAHITYKRSGISLTTDIAFPTTFIEWPDFYTWNGTLLTTDSHGETICSTATDTEASVIIDYWTQYSTAVMPTHPVYGSDPQGLLFTTYYLEMGGYGMHASLYSDDGAFQSCTPDPNVAPANAEMTARFITATSVSYEGGSSTPSSRSTATSTSSGGKPTSKAAPASTQAAQISPTTPQAAPVTVSYTETVLSTTLATSVSDSPSGPVTLINTMVETVEVVNVAVTSNTQATGGSATTVYSTVTNDAAAGMRNTRLVALGCFVGLLFLL